MPSGKSPPTSVVNYPWKARGEWIIRYLYIYIFYFLAIVARFLITRARFMEWVNTTQKFPFPFLNCDMVLPGSTPENVANIWQIKWNWIIDKVWNSGNSLFKRRFRFVVIQKFCYLLCSERFFSGYSGFPLSSKTSISKFQFDQESGRRRTTLWMGYLQIIIYLFIYLFILTTSPLHLIKVLLQV